MDRADLERVVRDELNASEWHDGTEWHSNIEASIDAYLGRDTEPAMEGQADAQSRDVADMVEAVTAQIMPAFDYEQIAEFEPRGTQDAIQARFESREVNRLMRHSNRSYTRFQEAVRNALITRNAVLWVKTEVENHVTSNRYKRLSDEAVAEVLRPTSTDQRVDTLREKPHEDGTTSLTVRRTTTLRRVTIESVETANFVIEREYGDIDLQECGFCGVVSYPTGSELVRRGASKERVAKLPPWRGPTKSSQNAMSANRSDPHQRARQRQDPSTQIYQEFRLYMRADMDGDGIAERLEVVYIGDESSGEILWHRVHPTVPFATGTAFIRPNRWTGQSLNDKLGEIAKVKTEALRHWMNDLDKSNHPPRWINEDRVNEIDVHDKRANAVVRVEGDPNSAVVFEPQKDAGRNAQALADYMDTRRSEAGGAALDLQARDVEIAGETAHGVERQYSARELLALLMTRTLAETLIRSTFFLVHHGLRTGGFGPEHMLYASSLTNPNPREWSYRDEISITAGMSGAERAAHTTALEKVMADQAALMQQGMGEGIMVDMATMYTAKLDWVASMGIANPRRYYIDPRSDESLQAQQATTQRRQEEQQQQLELARYAAEAPERVEELRRQGAAFNNLVDNRTQSRGDALKTAVELVKLGQGSEEQVQELIQDADQAAS